LKQYASDRGLHFAYWCRFSTQALIHSRQEPFFIFFIMWQCHASLRSLASRFPIKENLGSSRLKQKSVLSTESEINGLTQSPIFPNLFQKYFKANELRSEVDHFK